MAVPQPRHLQPRHCRRAPLARHARAGGADSVMTRCPRTYVAPLCMMCEEAQVRGAVQLAAARTAARASSGGVSGAVARTPVTASQRAAQALFTPLPDQFAWCGSNARAHHFLRRTAARPQRPRPTCPAPPRTRALRADTCVGRLAGGLRLTLAACGLLADAFRLTFAPDSGLAWCSDDSSFSAPRRAARARALAHTDALGSHDPGQAVAHGEVLAAQADALMADEAAADASGAAAVAQVRRVRGRCPRGAARSGPMAQLPCCWGLLHWQCVALRLPAWRQRVQRRGGRVRLTRRARRLPTGARGGRRRRGRRRRRAAGWRR